MNPPGSSGFYCYPEPNDAAGPGVNPCECGDLAVSFEDAAGNQTWDACLARGEQVSEEPVPVKIIAEASMGVIGVSDLTQCEILTTLDGADIPLDVCYGYNMFVDLDQDGVEDDEAPVVAVDHRLELGELQVGDEQAGRSAEARRVDRADHRDHEARDDREDRDDDQDLDHATTASPLKDLPGPGPVYLQAHGNPVRFRNVWVLPR